MAQAALAACQIVAPSGAVTSRPSIVNVTVPVLSGAVIAIVAVSARARHNAKVRSSTIALSGHSS